MMAVIKKKTLLQPFLRMKDVDVEKSDWCELYMK